MADQIATFKEQRLKSRPFAANLLRRRQEPRLRRPLPFADRRPAWPEVSPPAEPIPDRRHRIPTAGERGRAGELRFRPERGLPGFEAAKGLTGKQQCRIPRSGVGVRSRSKYFALRTTTGRVPRPLLRVFGRKPSWRRGGLDRRMPSTP